MTLNSTFRILRHILAATLCLLVASPYAAALAPDFYTKESKLATGKWVKIRVENSGVYAITSANASSWGFSDLSKVKVFGYGGAQISSLLNENQIDDLPQVPTYRDADGKIIFYAQGPTSWSSSAGSTMSFVQVQHAYSTAGYYFITDRDDIEPLKLESVNTPPASSTDVVTSFTDRIFHEQELFSPGQTGNFLLGEDFRYNSSQTFKFTLDDIVDGSTVKVLTAFAVKATGSSPSTLSFAYNGTKLEYASSDAINAISSTDSYTHCRLGSSVKQFPLTGSNLQYNVAFSNSGSVINMARLNYITINYTRHLSMTGSDLAFRYNGTTSSVLGIANADASTVLLDVTTSHKPSIIATTTVGSEQRFSPAQAGLREYRAINPSGNFPSPTRVGDVACQNLHGDSIPDMIIITPSEFRTQALRIAALHEQMDSMRVLTLSPEDIYNEFSSGTPDVMAYRKIAKMFYDRGTDATGHHLQHMLLFGRGSYDNRQITDNVKNDSYPRLLCWQNNVGDYDNTSFTTDDILGALADGASESNMSDPRVGGMNIGIGRMPVKSIAEAKTTVDKLISYVKGNNFGAWKNNVLMIADDGDNGQHMIQTDTEIARMQANGGSDYVISRIFLDAFTQNSDGSGNYYPDARKKFFQKLNDGLLLVNYIGHANTVSWTHDGLLNITDINNMYLKHYPLFYTATCEFTRLDADATSGGEILFLNSRGGAIALFSTTRPTYISDNEIMSRVFGEYAFRRDANNQYLRLGDIVRLTKNNATYVSTTGSVTYPNSNKLRFILVGDPAMRLAYPTYNVKLESINDIKISDDNMPDFKARQSITLKGAIYDTAGNKATDFNGTIQPTLFDAEQSVETKGNKASNEDDTIDKYVYQERMNRLAVAIDSVRNGEFSVKINIPSEIIYPDSYDNYSPAMVSFYAKSDNGIEANGSNDKFFIYGYDTSVQEDIVGPDISKMVLNSDSFLDDDDVNESPMLMAAVADSSGINFSTSGIGHQMTLLLDDKKLYTDVSTYFTPSITEGNTSGGNINYPLEGLSSGHHTLRLKVWDSFNNSSEKTISFNVVNGLKPDLYDVYSTANPAKTEANFYLTHNRPDATITVTLGVYNLLGQEVWSTTQTGRSDMFSSFPITWDLTDNAGRRVQRGIYVYRAGISTDGVQETTKSKKIAVAAP